MTSSRTQSFPESIGKPTAVAMVGSVGVHLVIAAFAALLPAESQTPQKLRIVSIAPRIATPNRPSETLPVPTNLPPVNLSQLPPFPEGLPPVSGTPSQSFYAGLDPATLNALSPSIGQLPITNPPIRSVPTVRPSAALRPDFRTGQSIGSLPQPAIRTAPRDDNPPAEDSTGSLKPPQSYDPSDYAVARNPDLPELDSGPFQKDFSGFYGGANSASGEPLPEANSPGALPDSLQAKKQDPQVQSQIQSLYKEWLTAQSDLYKQPLSAQPGPLLRANYPLKACEGRQEGSAIIAGIFTPEGELALRGQPVQVLQSIDDPLLNEAAIAAVERYRAPAVGAYQAFNFTVEVPYSAELCSAAVPDNSESKPEESSKDAQPKKEQPQASPTPTPTAKPTSAASPSPQPAPTPKSAQPASGPVQDSPVEETSVKESPAADAKADSQSAPALGNLQPLPQPSIQPQASPTVPENADAPSSESEADSDPDPEP